MGKAGFLDSRMLDKKSELKDGKLDLPGPLAQPPKCPECNSQRVWKDGLRKTRHGDVQRYLCRNCGFRFSKSFLNGQVDFDVSGQFLEQSDSGKNLLNTNVSSGKLAVKPSVKNPSFKSGEDVAPQFSSEQTIVGKALNSFSDYSRERQVCEFLTEDSKNLSKVESRIEKRAAGATVTKPTIANVVDVKGKIFEFAWFLKKQNYSKQTIKVYPTILKILLKRNVNLLNPEAVKEYLAKRELSEAYKHTIIATYTLFISQQGLQWEPPRCNITRKLPFIPTEKELDDLIAGCGKKTATFLELLKQTAMRCGEATRLEWTDIDFKRRTITLNKPEKNGNPESSMQAANSWLCLMPCLRQVIEYSQPPCMVDTQRSIAADKRSLENCRIHDWYE